MSEDLKLIYAEVGTSMLADSNTYRAMSTSPDYPEELSKILKGISIGLFNAGMEVLVQSDPNPETEETKQ